MQRISEIMVTLDFIFRLVLYSNEDVSFNIIFLNVLEGIKQFHLLMWFKENRLETPFKGDNVVLKYNVTLARPLRLVIPYFLMEILVRCSALVPS